METKLRMTSKQHKRLTKHLISNDGKESVAVALCGRSGALGTEVLLIHEINEIPHHQCRRSSSRVSWSPTDIEHVFMAAGKDDLAVVKFHSHPGGLTRFSDYDDESDRKFFSSVFGWVSGDRPHGSVVMLPDGNLFGRAIHSNGQFHDLNVISIVGDDVVFQGQQFADGHIEAFAERHRQLFGDETTKRLGNLRVAVVGCSGTGSIVIHQLGRLGVRELVLIDPDRVEERNLNRIMGATQDDATVRRLKTEVMKREISQIGLGTIVHSLPYLLEKEEAIRAVASSDIVIGCMDSLSGRNLLARLSRWYLLPYVDVGVKLEALPDGTINQIAGSVHYLRPDGQDFIDRGVFSAEALEAEDLYRNNQKEYKRRLDEGYIRGVTVERPAVVSVNTVFAGLAVQEMLARLHPFRLEANSNVATTRLSLSGLLLKYEEDKQSTSPLLKYLGRGDMVPLLGMPRLSLNQG